MSKTAADYYPSQVKLEIFPNKLYLLSWMLHGTQRSVLLNKAKAFTFVNDLNKDARLREELLNAFRAGVIT